MRNTLVSTDRFGDFILSSQVYTNARDLARFGLLYLQNGDVERRARHLRGLDPVRAHAGALDRPARQLLRRPVLARARQPDATCPKDAYSTHGNRGQYTVIVSRRTTWSSCAADSTRPPGIQSVGPDARSAQGPYK